MSGKPKKAGWGGARQNSGRKRKKKTTSEEVKGNYVKAAKKLAKEFGMTFEECMLRVGYNENTQASVRASIMKSYNEAMISKEVDQNINVTKKAGPVIGLPPIRGEDPALKIVDGKKG